MPTTIYLLRHAEALHNVVPHEYSGDPSKDEVFRDAILTEHGHTQASLLKPQIKDINFDVIYCSPLRRCIQTLKEAYPRSVHLHVNVDDRLLEQPYGTYISNKRHEKDAVAASIPVKWNSSNVSITNPFQVLSKKEEYHIIRGFIAEIIENHSEKSVLLVCHGRWINRFLKTYFGEGRHIHNCECIEVTIMQNNNDDQI